MRCGGRDEANRCAEAAAPILQVAFADKILLNKTDLVSEEEKQRVIRRIKVRPHAGHAVRGGCAAGREVPRRARACLGLRPPIGARAACLLTGAATCPLAFVALAFRPGACKCRRAGHLPAAPVLRVTALMPGAALLLPLPPSTRV